MTTAAWVDTHCHLFGSAEAPADLLQRAREAGVSWVVCPAVDEKSARQAAALAVEFPGEVLATAGLHPHYADAWTEQRDAIGELARDAVAIGECGLDFYRNLAPRQAQLAAFTDQLLLAVDLDKPIIVHCRDAFAEVYEALETTGTAERTVLHCWTGGPKWTKRFDDLGAAFSFAGPIAYPKGETVRLAAAVAPRDRTMVETDTPYLSPPPHRGEDNEPARVALVGAALAQVRGETVEEVAALTTANAERVFRG
ncbi:MAG: TatD family hydrolase [Acidimicrobiia bacterium]|nr:TatD family hydrolase [Acidimicrobiia bacterium]